MANAGDSYIITLSESHLMWGTHRYTDTRRRIYGESYIPIPRRFSIEYGIYNSNYNRGEDIIGINIFNAFSEDGLFSGVLKASGCSSAGSEYAKQFQGLGDLRAIGRWFNEIEAQVDDQIQVTWISESEISLRFIQND